MKSQTPRRIRNKNAIDTHGAEKESGLIGFDQA
jgi:hypothetical protein